MTNEAIRAIYKKMSKVACKARRRDNAYREPCYSRLFSIIES